jgi:hypothetical protein
MGHQETGSRWKHRAPSCGLLRSRAFSQEELSSHWRTNPAEQGRRTAGATNRLSLGVRFCSVDGQTPGPMAPRKSPRRWPGLSYARPGLGFSARGGGGGADRRLDPRPDGRAGRRSKPGTRGLILGGNARVRVQRRAGPGELPARELGIGAGSGGGDRPPARRGGWRNPLAPERDRLRGPGSAWDWSRAESTSASRAPASSAAMRGSQPQPWENLR